MLARERTINMYKWALHSRRSYIEWRGARQHTATIPSIDHPTYTRVCKQQHGYCDETAEEDVFNQL